ncbi:MAG: CDP-alcohol phosphatidyltransferase [Chitinophagaceae bacterium]|nr:MAG: CDP-alcohol phosphatidyltransferase [Chitinophagaceae bacterium]
MSLAEKPDIRGRASKEINFTRFRVFSDRKRTNVLRESEQSLILYLVQRIPSYISSDFLSFLGGIGSLIFFLAFFIASKSNSIWLLLAIAGLVINWFGDSLDGRLAYFRNTPRKWYGFALDIVFDWFSTVAIGFGYYVYAGADYKWLGLAFIALYGWAILIAQLRYKITDKYTIDSGVVGPTELRVIIALIIIAEVAFNGAIHYAAMLIALALFLLNFKDTLCLLEAGNRRDDEERQLLR